MRPDSTRALRLRECAAAHTRALDCHVATSNAINVGTDGGMVTKIVAIAQRFRVSQAHSSVEASSAVPADTAAIGHWPCRRPGADRALTDQRPARRRWWQWGR